MASLTGYAHCRFSLSIISRMQARQICLGLRYIFVFMRETETGKKSSSVVKWHLLQVICIVFPSWASSRICATFFVVSCCDSLEAFNYASKDFIMLPCKHLYAYEKTRFMRESTLAALLESNPTALLTLPADTPASHRLEVGGSLSDPLLPPAAPLSRQTFPRKTRGVYFFLFNMLDMLDIALT